MPLYEYQCEKCGHRFERIQKFSDKMVKKCPECGGPYLVEKWLKAGPVLQCPNAECKHKQPMLVPVEALAQ